MMQPQQMILPLALALALGAFGPGAMAQSDDSAFDSAGEFGSGAQNQPANGDAGDGYESLDGPSSSANQKPAQSDVERHQDWGVRCGEEKGGSGERCEMFQQLTRDDSDEPVMRVVVGYPPDSDQPAAILQLPLGILLPNGIALRVDEGEKIRLPVQICFSQGCRTDFPLKPELLSAMKAGSKAYVSVRDPRGRSVDLPISLKGFTSAFNSVSE